MKKTITISFAVVMVLALLSCPADAALMYIVDSGYNHCGPRDAKITTIDSITGTEQILNPGTGHNLTDIAVTPSGQGL